MSQPGPGVEYVAGIRLVSRDPERLVRFYREAFGLSFREEEYGEAQRYHRSWLAGLALTIHPVGNQEDSRAEAGAIRLSFETFDLGGLLAKLSAQGIPTHAPPRCPAGIRAASVRDPDGNEIVLTESPDSWFETLKTLRKKSPEPFARWQERLRRKIGRTGEIRQAIHRGWTLLRYQWAVWVTDPLFYFLGWLPIRVRDLRPFTHLVASREGLYAVNAKGLAKVAGGQFFGLTVLGSSIYLFQSHGYLVSKTKRGRVVKLDLEDGRIRRSRVVLRGLDNGCHQIDFLGSRLAVMDTYNQRVLIFDAEMKLEAVHEPAGPGASENWAEGYCHINSILARGERIYFLKHNGGPKTGRNSEILECDRSFRVQAVRSIPGGMCHNIVCLEDGQLLVCDSRGGNLVDEKGVVLNVGEMFVRGLSVDSDLVVVGESFFDSGRRRRYVLGKIYFYDRDFKLLSSFVLPAAPTDIRKIDGVDLSLSNCQAEVGAEGREEPRRSLRLVQS